MPKTKAKKAVKKEIKKVRKVERKVHNTKAHKGGGKTVPARFNEKNLNFKSANSQRPSVIPYKSSAELAKDYIFCLTNPWQGYVAGLNPVVPDGSMASTTTVWTKTIVNCPTVANGSTNDLYFCAFPFGNSHYQYAGTFASLLPTAFTSGNATNYASWGTSFDTVRCVCMGMQIRNTQAAGSESGDIIQFLAPYNVQTNLWSYFANQSDSVLRGLTKPGDMGLQFWRPSSIVATGDKQFKLPSMSAGNFGSAGAAATMMAFWAQCQSAATFEITLYAAWEARPLATVSGLFDVQTNCGDPSEANKLLMKTLARDPVWSQGRVAVQDDGSIDSIAKDAKAIYGGVTGALGAAKNIGGAIGDLFGSFFNETPKQKVGRILEHFTVHDECVFQELLDYINYAPRATLADALVYFYQRIPPPQPDPPNRDPRPVRPGDERHYGDLKVAPSRPTSPSHSSIVNVDTNNDADDEGDDSKTRSKRQGSSVQLSDLPPAGYYEKGGIPWSDHLSYRGDQDPPTSRSKSTPRVSRPT
jgi:hypothetical protein